MPTPENRSGAPWSSSTGCAPSPLTTIRNTPTPIIVSAAITKRYVGIAKMFPDSRRPRRLPIVMSTMATAPMTSFQSCSSGTAEMTCSAADAVDTATVIT